MYENKFIKYGVVFILLLVINISSYSKEEKDTISTRELIRDENRRISFLNFTYSKRNINKEKAIFGTDFDDVIGTYQIGGEASFSVNYLDTLTKFSVLDLDLLRFYIEGTFANIERPVPNSAVNEKEELRILEYGYNFSYGKGYGWKMGEKSYFYLVHNKGLGASFEAAEASAVSISREPDVRMHDFTESMFRFHYGRNFAAHIGFKTNATYFNNSFDGWALNKLVDLGGNVLIDRFFTQYLISKQNKYAPVYNILAQFAWSYLGYTLKKDNTYFPFSKKDGEFAIVDNRFMVGVSFRVF